MTEINPSNAPGRAYIPEGIDPLQSEVPAVTYNRLSEDEISTAGKKNEEFKAPKPGDPGIEKPGGNGDQQVVDGALIANPWLSNPSVMALLFLVLLEYQENMSIQRVTEADMKIALSEATFKVGLENADLVKKLKDLEADNKFLEAMGNFASAAIAVGSIGMVAAQRSQTKTQTDNSPAGIERDKQKTEMDKMNANFFDTPTTQTTDSSPQQLGPKYKDEADLNARGTRQEKAAYKGQKEKLAAAQKGYDIEYQTNLTANQAIERHASEALQNTVQGTVKMISAGIIQEQGAVEQLKAMNETIQQFWSRLIDSTGQSKESLLAEVNRVLQLLASMSSEMRNRMQRG